MGRMAASDRATLRKSSRPSPGFRLSGRSMGAATTSTAITGNPVKNTEPHQKSWSKTPPTTGPMAVLGPLAVWTSAGEAVTVPGLKVRALLADLLVYAGQPVSADRLVDDLWGERPPADPAGALQVKVSQLRRGRHRLFYTTLAEQARTQLRGHAQRQWLERLDRETANVHSALNGAIRHREAHLALRLASAMTWYWFLRGRLTEARRALEAALAVEADAPGIEEDATALEADATAAARAFAIAWQAGITLLAGGGGGDLAAHARTALKPYEGIDDPGGRAASRRPAVLARPDRDAVRRPHAGARAARARRGARRRAEVQTRRGIR